MKPKVEVISVGEKGAGKRLDHFLSRRFPTWSRSFWQAVIARGGVEITRQGLAPGSPQASRRLLQGDSIYIDSSFIRQEDPHPFDEALRILHCKERFIAVDKAAGLLSHPAGLFGGGSLIDLLKERFSPLHLCGRLDRFTSGILLLARDKEALSQFEQLSFRGLVGKYYLALVEGVPKEPRGFIEAPIAKDENSSIKLKMAISPRGKKARTEYELVSQKSSAKGLRSILKLRLETGRKHQIRLHLDHIDCPIVGDKLYGREIDYEYFTPGRGNLHSYWPSWHGLHCYRLSFPSTLVELGGQELLLEPKRELAKEIESSGFTKSDLAPLFKGSAAH